MTGKRIPSSSAETSASALDFGAAEPVGDDAAAAEEEPATYSAGRASLPTVCTTFDTDELNFASSMHRKSDQHRKKNQNKCTEENE
jgi:hypothetical protein